MSFEFTETLTIEVPDVEEKIAAFGENEYKKTHGLIIEVAAIHEGMTANFNYYPSKALEESLESWIKPYPKPIIMNHDPTSEPVGRVMAAKMEEEDDGTPYVMLRVAITDPEAIAKVSDQRYLTGSVGGSAKQANCSVCGADWAEASIRNIPCKHSRGKTYKGKLCYMEMNGIGFKEYSFVNMPADQHSGVRAMHTASEGEIPEADDNWIRAAKIYSLNMDNEEILEFSESEENLNILEEKSKKEASWMYAQFKGSFLSALIAESEEGRNDEELDVSTNIINEEEEDILEVTEGLSSDLADTTEAEEESEEEAVAEEEVDSAVEETEEEVEESEEEVSEEVEASEDKDEEEVEEAADKKPEAQESPRDKDVDPDNSDGAPVSREDDEEDEVVEEGEEEEVVNEEESSETDLNEEIVTLESRVEELESREQALLEENAKLKAAIKRQLAERVVDMKVALGLIEAEDRAEELEEHAKRSAGSLADSMRDLAGMAKVQKTDISPPQVNNESAAVAENDASVVVDDDGELEEDEDKDPEDVFVDALMGRRKL